jgi:hypothetical protein
MGAGGDIEAWSNWAKVSAVLWLSAHRNLRYGINTPTGSKGRHGEQKGRLQSCKKRYVKIILELTLLTETRWSKGDGAEAQRGKSACQVPHSELIVCL